MALTLGARLKELREQRGWSQSRLAKASRVSTRTIERIESGHANPHLSTQQAIAAAMDLEDVSELRTGLSSDEHCALAEEFTCKTCGAPLDARDFIDTEYGYETVDVFRCGHMRGWKERPCPRDPRFPKFEDYALTFEQEAEGTWLCHAAGKTVMACQVDLPYGVGPSKEEARNWVELAYIRARDGFEAACEFQREVMG